VTHVPPSAPAADDGYPPHLDDDTGYLPAHPGGGHRSARRPGPLRRLFGRRNHDDDPSLDWAAPQGDEPDWANGSDGTGVAGGAGTAGGGGAAGGGFARPGQQPGRVTGEDQPGRDGRPGLEGLPVREVPGRGPIPGRNGLNGTGAGAGAGAGPGSFGAAGAEDTDAAGRDADWPGAPDEGWPGGPGAVPTYRALHRADEAGPGTPPAPRTGPPGVPTFTPAPGATTGPLPATGPGAGSSPAGAPWSQPVPAEPPVAGGAEGVTGPVPEPGGSGGPGGPGGSGRPGGDGPGDSDGGLLYRVLGGLAMRDLTLVESLLQVVEKLESNEEDEGQLELLFRIDHLATRMRRNSENLLVLAGHDPQGRDLEPVPLLDVARAAISEITDYSRAQISALPDIEVLGLAADDLSHILAELLENATSKSPESAAVVIRAERTGDGTMVISVEDSGIGLPPDQLADINQRLGRAPVVDPTVTRHMGLYVVGRLAQRHGIRVQLRERPYGGITANVITPSRLIRVNPETAPRTARRPATRPQPVVAPGGPRLTAVNSDGHARPGTGGQSAPPRRERPLPPPGPASSGPAAPPPPPRFAPADPSTLPQRTPSRAATASPPPRPAASPEPESSVSRADRIRDDLSDFRLGQREARSAAPGPTPPAPASPPAPPSTTPSAPPPSSPGATPEIHHSDDSGRPNGVEGERPGEGPGGSQAGTEADST